MCWTTAASRICAPTWKATIPSRSWTVIWTALSKRPLKAGCKERRGCNTRVRRRTAKQVREIMADEQNTPNGSANDSADENRLIAERRAKLAAWREQGAAFPNDFRRDALAADLQAQYGELSKEELEERDIQVAVAGRLMLDRKAFKVLQDMS